MTANSSPVPRLDENNTNPALARARAARAITRSIDVEGEEVTVDDAPPARPTAAARAMHSSPTQPATQQQDEEPQLVGTTTHLVFAMAIMEHEKSNRQLATRGRPELLPLVKR
eukprot:2597978-Prymnesium_polylepis.1